MVIAWNRSLLIQSIVQASVSVAFSHFTHCKTRKWHAGTVLADGPFSGDGSVQVSVWYDGESCLICGMMMGERRDETRRPEVAGKVTSLRGTYFVPWRLLTAYQSRTHHPMR